MRRAIALSVSAHVAVVAIAYVGLPMVREPLTDLPPVMIEVAVVSEMTNVPPPAPRVQQPPEAPKPPPRAETPPPPQTAAVSPPKPEAAPEPLPKPIKVQPDLKPEPKPEPKVQAPPPRALADVKPERKPKPADPFASVLRTLEDLKRPSQPPETSKEQAKPQPKPQPNENFEQQIAKALSSAQRPFDASQSLSISEIDLVRQQIAACWNLPVGAKDAENLVIEIRVVMNSDGSVREARIQDQGRMGRDPFFRAAAESALRAVLNPRCNPLKLPPEKYAQWQTMTLSFNPRQMFGT